jgi:dTDP-4-amino-4,6-dideoxygalactose transaminase
LCECVISLPMHSELTEEQQQFIVDSILEFIKQ